MYTFVLFRLCKIIEKLKKKNKITKKIKIKICKITFCGAKSLAFQFI